MCSQLTYSEDEKNLFSKWWICTKWTFLKHVGNDSKKSQRASSRWVKWNGGEKEGKEVKVAHGKPPTFGRYGETKGNQKVQNHQTRNIKLLQTTQIFLKLGSVAQEGHERRW